MTQSINISKKNWRGTLQITSTEQWAYHLVIPLKQLRPNLERVLLINLKVENGAIGILLENIKEIDFIKEYKLVKGENKIAIDLPAKHNFNVYIRNIYPKGSSSYQINEIRLEKKETIILRKNIQKEIKNILLSKNDEYKKNLAIRNRLHPSQIKSISIEKDKEIDLNLSTIFDCKNGLKINESINQIIDRLHLIEVSKLRQNQGEFDKNYFTKYLKQSVIRIYHLVKMLDARGIKNAKILDVGSLLGTFSVPLKKFGHEVVAVDRFSSFDGSLDALLETMKDEGIKIVNVNESNETEILSGLGFFDLVISMAVIEHIPHTPRFFLENLKKRVKPKGWFAIDTPNLSRYWNRHSIMNDGPVMQDMKFQYFSEIPFCGHHREYTQNELIWMFNQTGYTNIEAIRFDYNLFQFEKLTKEHINSLFSMQIDPSLMDTIMIMGQNN